MLLCFLLPVASNSCRRYRPSSSTARSLSESTSASSTPTFSASTAPIAIALGIFSYNHTQRRKLVRCPDASTCSTCAACETHHVERRAAKRVLVVPTLRLCQVADCTVAASASRRALLRLTGAQQLPLGAPHTSRRSDHHLSLSVSVCGSGDPHSRPHSVHCCFALAHDRVHCCPLSSSPLPIILYEQVVRLVDASHPPLPGSEKQTVETRYMTRPFSKQQQASE